MAVGQKYAFLQFGNSIKATIDTAGATITLATTSTGLPATEMRVQNLLTATIWVAQGAQATSSAAVTSAGICIMPTNQYGCIQVLRTNGNTTVVAFAVGATQTSQILFTAGEGLAT